jgi:anti-anti-sigma factor
MIDLLSRTGCGPVRQRLPRPASPHPLPATTRPVSTPQRAALPFRWTTVVRSITNHPARPDERSGPATGRLAPLSSRTVPQQTDTPTASFVATVDLHGRTTLVVSGEIDLDSAPVLERLVVLHLRAAGELGVDLDLSLVRFFSAAGVHALLAAVDPVDPAGAPLRITLMSPEVERMLELTRTQDRLDPDRSGTCPPTTSTS